VRGVINFGGILMTELNKGCRGFEKLLLALERHSKDQTLQTKKWVNIWCMVANYRSYCYIHKVSESRISEQCTNLEKLLAKNKTTTAYQK
jgi:hypothetical protein